MLPICSAAAPGGMRKTGRVQPPGTSSRTRLPATSSNRLPRQIQDLWFGNNVNVGRRKAGCGYVNPNRRHQVVADPLPRSAICQVREGVVTTASVTLQY